MSNTTPNLYQLSGNGLHISYSTTGIDGKTHMTYQDQQQTLNFAGDTMRTVEADLGMVVSVTIRGTVDAGSTTFSVLLPRVNLGKQPSLTIQTEGITAIHKFSTVPVFSQGQLDVYSAQVLHGTASFVDF